MESGDENARRGDMRATATTRGKQRARGDGADATSSSSYVRSGTTQNLLDNADRSMSFLASMGEWMDDRGIPAGAVNSSQDFTAGTGAETAAGAWNAPSAAQHAAEDSANFFASLQVPQVLPTNHDDEAMRVVDLSVAKGMLHIKGIFPDHSVEYVDMDPRFTTIGELKRALCTKRGAEQALGLPPTEARVMFSGQLVEDDWLVVDCGLGVDGAIFVVRALPTTQFGGHYGLVKKDSRPFDPRLTVASIASSYPQAQTSTFQQQQQQQQPQAEEEEDMSSASMLVECQQFDAMALSRARGAEFSSHVRPEEAQFADMVADFEAHVEGVHDTDAYSERLLRGYIDVLQARLEALDATAEGMSRHATEARQRLRDQIRELRDERNTWRLLFELRRICHPTDRPGASESEMDTEMAMGVHPMEDQQGEDMALRFDMVDEDAVRLLESRSEDYRIQKAVKTWLEHMALEKTITMNEKRNAGKLGSRTLKLVKKGLVHNDGKMIAMDPDAPLRDGDHHIVEDDAEDEAELLKGMWSFIRAGNVQDAVELCVRMGEPWRAASISGGSYVGASEVDDDRALERWGNPMRALWKTTCWKFAEQEGMSLTKHNSLLARQYERIVYGALGGHAHVVTRSALCESWEDHCWAYLHAITEQQVDEVLHDLLKVKLQSTQLVVGNNAHFLRLYHDLLAKTKHLKRYQLNLDLLFDELKNSDSDVVRKQANEPHRLIQAKLVTAKVQYVVANILDAVLFDPKDDSYDWELRLGEHVRADDVSPFFLRFAAHFVLFAGFTGESFDHEASHMILKAYIRHLVKHGHLKLVPIYASKLPEQGAIELYVQIICSVDDRLQREMCLKRILEYSSMDVVTTVVTTTVERLCAEYQRQATEQVGTASGGHKTLSNNKTMDTATTTLDRKRMHTVQVLCMYNEHRAAAIRVANLLARQFVLEGKVNAVKELFVEHLPDDSMGVVTLHRGAQSPLSEKAIDYAVREYLCWKAYLRACNHYDLWRSCTRDPRGGGASSLKSAAVYSEEKDFVTELMYHIARSTKALLEVLHFENGWMRHCADDSAEDDKEPVSEGDLIRRICLPVLVFNLHFIQLESAKLILRLRLYPMDAKLQLARPLLEKSLEVADVVAAEHYAVSSALTAEHCRDLLSGFRESAIALLHLEASETTRTHEEMEEEGDDLSSQEADGEPTEHTTSEQVE